MDEITTVKEPRALLLTPPITDEQQRSNDEGEARAGSVEDDIDGSGEVADISFELQQTPSMLSSPYESSGGSEIAVDESGDID
jgi:hypothetical protein